MPTYLFSLMVVFLLMLLISARRSKRSWEIRPALSFCCITVKLAYYYLFEINFFDIEIWFFPTMSKKFPALNVFNKIIYTNQSWKVYWPLMIPCNIECLNKKCIPSLQVSNGSDNKNCCILDKTVMCMKNLASLKCIKHIL